MAPRARSLTDLPRWRVRDTAKMPLDPSVLGAVVRINTFGDLLGTGFIMTVPSEADPQKKWGYVVTADHVIRGQVGIEVEVPDAFELKILQAPVTVMTDWMRPLPDVDIAIAPFELFPGVTTIRKELALPPDLVPPLGAPIHYLGIFAPFGTPMARSGTIGALDHQISKTGDGRGYEYEAHLVDCRSYAGFSGSPCFSQVAYAAANLPPENLQPIEASASGVLPELLPLRFETHLAGMFTAHVTDEVAETQDGIASRYGVGVMLPSKAILEALMSDEAKADRAKRDHDRAQKKSEGPSITNAAADPPGDRDRDEVMSDFERISGPLRGQNRDRKPKA
jgi:hypothetical protein